jgi:hypothetical protein
MTARMVRIRYASRTGGLTKKLFGYQRWKTRTGGRMYWHKAINGKLKNLPVEKAGRSAVIAPQNLVPEIKKAIDEAGGVILSIEPVILNKTIAEKTVKDFQVKFVDLLVNFLNYAAEAEDKEVYVSAIEKGLELTKSFESFIKQVSEHSKQEEDSQVMTVLQGLKTIASQDLEAAKLQAESFAIDLESLHEPKLSNK